MGTFTSTTNGNINDGGTYGNTSPGSAGVDFPGTNDICVVGGSTTVTLNTNFECRALKITGTLAGGNNTITLNGATSNKPFDHDGTITGDLNVTITNTGMQQNGLLLDGSGVAGNINNLTINMTSATASNNTIEFSPSLVLDNTLTITAGVFQPYASTFTLTVGGHIFGNGTFNANDSTVTVAGQCAPANVGLIGGSITSNDDFRPTTKTTITGNGTITATGGSQIGGLFDIGATNTPTLQAGRLHSSLDIPTGNQGQSTFNLALNEPANSPARHVYFYNLVLDSEGTENNTLTMADAITCTGDLTITDGKIDTGSTGRAITVTGDVNVASGGTLDIDAASSDANYTFGSLQIASGGTVEAPSHGTITILGEHTNGFALFNEGTFTHNNGTVSIGNGTTAAETHIKITTLYNLIINSNADAKLVIFRPESSSTVTIANDLTLTRGVFYRNNASDTLTVTGDVSIASGSTLGRTNDSGASSFGSLTIASGGTYIATSGETSIMGAAGINRAGTFTHNNGTVDFEAATTVIQSTTMTGSNAFYILKSTGQTWYRIDQDIDIERHASTGYVFWFYGNVTVTMGTDTYASGTDNSNRCINWSYVYGHTSSTYKLYAKNELYPWQYDYAQVGNSSWINGSQDGRMGTVHLKGGNIIGDFSIAETTNPKSMVLDGDMEFDGLIVGNTNTLDLNGQRVEFGGLLNNQGILTDGGDKSLVLASNIDTTGTTRNISGASDLILTGSGNIYWGTTGGGWNTAFFNGGAFNTWAGSDTSGTTLIGAGDLDVLNATSFGNIQVATGGELDGNSSTLTVAGDFTTSGGLIGKSALSFPDGGNSPSGAGNALDVPYDLVNLTGDATIEFWMKAAANTNDASRGIINGYKGGIGNRWQLYQTTSNNMTFYSHDYNKSITVTCPTEKWSHVAIVCTGTGGDAKLYINGKLEGQTELGSGVSLATSGAFPDFGLNRQDGSSDIRAGQRLFEGDLAMLRIWTDERTPSELRANMFATYANLASNTGCAIAYEFDEGTSTDVDDKVGSNNGTLVNSVTWAGAGTFTHGTSTLDIIDDGTIGIASGVTQFNNLKVAASGKTTTLAVLAGASDIRFHGTLTHGGGTANSSGNPAWTMKGTSTVSAGSDWSNWYLCYWESSTAVPTATWRYWIAIGNNISLAGDMTCTGYFRPHQKVVSSGDYTITTYNALFHNSGGLNMGAGSLIFTHAQGLSDTTSLSVFTAGPGATVTGVAGKSTFKSQNNFAVVGKIENLDVTNEELKVTGQVINCTGDIHQYFPTIDHDQQLDADTADDRDVNLGRDLDKNTELINS